MMRRSFAALSLLVLAAAPLAAQSKESDPDKKVAGGSLPAGWTGRTDKDNAQLSDAKFFVAGSGLHVTSGPAAIYWRHTDNVTGPFTLSTTFTQTKAPAHPEAYGLFFVGQSLNSPQQSYAYFLVRGDGKFLVNHRAGADVHKIIAWTDNAAVRKQDAAGKATNTLTVDASRTDSLRLLVNGTQVAAFPATQFGTTNGFVGLRVNHNLDVHIADYAITPKRTAAAKAPAKASPKKPAKKAPTGA